MEPSDRRREGKKLEKIFIDCKTKLRSTYARQVVLYMFGDRSVLGDWHGQKTFLRTAISVLEDCSAALGGLKLNHLSVLFQMMARFL